MFLLKIGYESEDGWVDITVSVLRLSKGYKKVRTGRNLWKKQDRGNTEVWESVDYK